MPNILERLLGRGDKQMRSKSVISLQNWMYPPSDSGGRGSELSRNDRSAAVAATIVEDVYSALAARVRAVNAVEWQISKLQGNQPNEDDEIVSSSSDVIPQHPLGAAIRRFYVEYGIPYFGLWHYSQMVTGAWYTQVLRNRARRGIDLEWYNPLHMDVQESNGRIEAFTYNGEGRTIRFGRGGDYPLDEMVYHKYMNLLDELRGQSPVEAAISSVNVDRNTSRAINAYFRNGMNIGMIISPQNGGTWTEDDIHKLIRELKQQNQGVENTGKNTYMPYGVDVTTPDRPNFEQDLAAAERATRKINKVLGVPDAIAGDPSGTKYKEHPELYNSWMELQVLPELYVIQDMVNYRIMPKLDDTGSYYFSFNVSPWLDKLNEDDQMRREAATTDLQNGAITVAEYRQRIGDALTDEEQRLLDVYYLPGSSVVVPRQQYNEMVAGGFSASSWQEQQAVAAAESAEPVLASGDNETQQDTVDNNQQSQDAPPTRDYTASYDEQLAELKAWQTFTRNGKHHKRDFVVEALRADVEHFIKAGLQAGDDLPQLFSAAYKRLDLKAIQATRLEFENRFRLVLQEARNGNITRRRFGVILRGIIDRFGRQAFIDGLQDGGVQDADLSDEDDRAKVDAIKREQSKFVTELGRVIYQGDGLSEQDATQKPSMWWRKSIKPFYDAGLVSANNNQMLEFVGPDGLESCVTCQTLKYQRHRAKTWASRRLRPGVDTENFVCGGWRCEHILVPVRGKARGRLPRKAELSDLLEGSTCDHQHDVGDVLDLSHGLYTKIEYDEYYATEGYTHALDVD